VETVHLSRERVGGRNAKFETYVIRKRPSMRRAPGTFRNFDPKSRSGGRHFAGLEVFLGSPFQAVFLFRAINAAFLEDFVLCGHDYL